MFRPLLPLLPALTLCLPAFAAMPAGLSLGEKEKDVLQKVFASEDFTPLNDRAKRKLEGNYSLHGKVGGQQWLAHFIFDRRSKQLTQLLFIGETAMQPNQYNRLLKSFYVFTTDYLRAHFQLQDPLNTPEFGQAGSLKTETMFPLHAYPGEGIMLTTGLWKDKNGGIHICFTVQPSSNSAMGQTYTSNTSGKPADWMDIPAFASTDEGKDFLKATGLAGAPSPLPPAPEEEEPEEEEDSLLAEEESHDDTPSPLATASEDLPLVEQDVLNALIIFDRGTNIKDGLAKLINAAQAGNARALYELGCGYDQGRHGLSLNKENAEAAFRKSAMGGFALALVRYGAEFPVALGELGFKAIDGNNMVKTAEAAGASSPSQRFNYAIMLRYGYGVRKDVAKACELMRQLATEGDPIAAKLADEWAE